MFIRSTGLGRTLLTGRVAKIVATTMVPSTLEKSQNGVAEPARLLVEMEITNPVHWTVRAFIDPQDLRAMLKIILTSPGLMFSCLKFLFRKGTKYDESARQELPAAGTAPMPLRAAAPLPVPALAPKGPSAIPARKIS